MSGPSTRSHRSSVRAVEATLIELSDLLKANKSVVLITGAGLSAASGIPTFRGGSDSIWCVTAAAQGRRSMFLRDPLRWYNEFWLRQFPVSFTRMTPNSGHEAIAALARDFPAVRVITQNIDALHKETAIPWPDPTRLIEAHGRLGLFKCVAEEEDADEGSENECPFSWEKEIRPCAFPAAVREALEADPHSATAAGVGCLLTEIPRCPHCGGPSPPMSLLFDEDYDSHSFYDFERAQDWLKEADSFVFIGTSFAVTLTSLAIQEAKRRKIPVFDFNLSVTLKATPTLDAKTVLGRAENTLPELARLAGAPIGAELAESAAVVAGEEDISPLGRRSRDESPEGSGSGHGDVGEEPGAAKVPRTFGVDVRGEDAAGQTTVAATVTRGLSASATPWGGGAPFLLDPVLSSPLRKDQVRIDLSEEFSRKIHPDEEVEALMEFLWQEQLARNPLLFNGSKFRLAGYSTEGGRAAAAAADEVASSIGASEGGGGGQPRRTIVRASTPPPAHQRGHSSPTQRLRLRLGLTDYRTFRGTNWSPAAARLAADSARDFPWIESAYLSQKLGVGAIVETSDGFILSLRRSQGVGEGQGMLGQPGGHPEPEKLGLTGDVLRALSGKLPASRRRMGLQAAEELFDSALQEVVDETNVPRSALNEPLMSGIVRQGNSFGAPTAAFVISCSLPHAEVLELYTRGAKEAFESTELYRLPTKEILAEGGAEWFASRNLQATPSFQGSLELWRKHRLAGTF